MSKKHQQLPTPKEAAIDSHLCKLTRGQRSLRNTGLFEITAWVE